VYYDVGVTRLYTSQVAYNDIIGCNVAVWVEYVVDIATSRASDRPNGKYFATFLYNIANKKAVLSQR